MATGASAADLYVSRSHPALGEDSDSDDIEVPRFQSLDCAEDSDGDLEVDRDNDLKIITTVIRGCSHITSAKIRGSWTPPPPSVSNGQHLASPPSPPRQQWSAFGLPPLPRRERPLPEKDLT